MSLGCIRIVGADALSALGAGISVFEDRISSNPATGESSFPPNDDVDEWPTEVEYRPARFEVSSVLGAQRVQTIDRTTALTLCTAIRLHGSLRLREYVPDHRLGIVVGTSTGSIKSYCDFVLDSYTQPRPYLVNPRNFPSTLLNYAASQCAIHLGARSVNATVSGGRLSGLLALKYASRMLERNYADLVLAGSVEELCRETAWSHRLLVQQGYRNPVPLGDGCAMFGCISVDSKALAGPWRPLADIVALETVRFSSNGSYRDGALGALIECLSRALNSAGIGSGSISDYALCDASEVALGDLEREAARTVFGQDLRPINERFIDCVGETYSASFSLALAWLLSSSAAGPRYAAVLATEEDGQAGCLIVRILPT